MKKNIEYYDQRRDDTYGYELKVEKPGDHSFYGPLKRFIDGYSLYEKKCLEIGSARGLFQDMVEDYTGTDVAESVRGDFHKPYKVMEPSGRYPFDDEAFDAIWTITVYEHIPDLQKALLEIDRLIKPGGVVFFAPAWQCRPWNADGYPVRPYSDFGWKGKLIKASIPLRNSVFWRSMFLFPKRFFRAFAFAMGNEHPLIKYRKIKPNWDHYWMSDADACNSIDPHDAILWFESHGFRCLSHPLHRKAFLVRTGGLVLRKKND